MDGPTIQKTSDAFYGRIRGIIFSIRNKSVYRKEAAMPSKEKMADVIRKMFSITEDAASYEEIRERLLSGGKITGTNMVVMVCAIIIACVGLNTDSIAVIIGAMLISPLMGSILAMAYGTETGDGDLFRRHALGFAFQVVVSVATAVIYFLISPIKQPTAQIIARTQPTFFDVLVAVAGGVAGIVGQTRKDKANNIIPGVAIATALMPPLCTCGYAISAGNLRMLGGAAYLFLLNSYFIFMSGCLVLSLLNVPKVKEISAEKWKVMRRRMWLRTIIITLPSILAIYSVYLVH